MHEKYKRIENVIAHIMFWMTTAFLTLFAIIIQYLQTDDGLPLPFFQYFLNLLFILWTIFLIERIIYVMFCKQKASQYIFHSLIVIFPPLHLAARRCHQQKYLWWNKNWQLIDQALYEQIEKQFLYPILTISLLMVPFWLAEIFFQSKIGTHPLLYHAINGGNAIIWGLFVSEFIIMLSMSQKPGTYVIKHWLELFIILLPILALSRFFLLSKYLQLSKNTYVLWVLKLQKMVNVYRARVVINRLVRILVLVKLVKRFYQHHNPEKYLTILNTKLAEKEQEMIELKQQILDTERLVEQKQLEKQSKGE